MPLKTTGVSGTVVAADEKRRNKELLPSCDDNDIVLKSGSMYRWVSYNPNYHAAEIFCFGQMQSVEIK